MKKFFAAALALTLLTAFFLLNAAAQQSDFAIKKSFEDRFRSLLDRVDAAKTTSELDSLKSDVEALDASFSQHSAFLDKALYPQTYDESMSVLRKARALTSDRVFLIQSSGVRIAELEAKVDFLSSRIDTLTLQRNSLFAELAAAKQSNASLRDLVKRLSANLLAKDKLVTALVDSIFRPYGKDVAQLGGDQKEALASRIDKANLTARIYDVADDNVKFLGVTQLQGKDYASLIDQYTEFTSKWSGLGEKINAVSAPPVTARPARKPQSPGKETAVPKQPASFSLSVDSVITLWHGKLTASFWSGLAKEFANNQTQLAPFKDGPSFSTSLRAYIADLTARKEDPTPFVENVWKARIDKEWREALSKEGMLGKAEYASLDKLVSELKTDKFDLRIYGYGAVVIAILAGLWWIRPRKPKPLPGK